MLDHFLIQEHRVLLVKLFKALSLVLALEDFLELEIFHDLHGVFSHNFIDGARLLNLLSLSAQGMLAPNQAILRLQIDV